MSSCSWPGPAIRGRASKLTFAAAGPRGGKVSLRSPKGKPGIGHEQPFTTVCFPERFNALRLLCADRPGATTVSTAVDEVLNRHRGVCQDFVHLMLACLRSHGLAACYVTGYLLTEPPHGMPRLWGVEASYASVAAHLPGPGWVEFDPTNDQLADQRYITLAWGTGFADVVPVRGVILGGGSMQGMDAFVSVMPQG